ncbi:ribosome biogenesis protein NOP53 [Neopsephotus bourkii]|uniref:ribosome biogenesis protein NOP53 n=1 Tax=Neopsephotus bourkii TaxID=309878 RepID=UPI002AA51B0A|nr:ribosome biogenesis protein NOP53 [Neopsephotus bourkii]
MAAAEASASFLGLGPGSRDPGVVAASRRRSRGPRNRKKAWKRLSGPEARLGREIADFLEDVALEQRTTGGLISEQPDEGLFFLDTGNATKDKGEDLGSRPPLKPLHVDLVLQPLSKVPAPKDILAHQIPNARKLRRRREFWARQAEKGLFPREERRFRNRLRRDPPPSAAAPPPHLEKGRSDPHREFYDLWGAHNPLDQALVGQDPWFLQQTKKLKVKRPSRLQPLPEVPALEVIDGGGSYNPTFGEHQALLLRAHEEELRKQRAEEKLERRLQIPAGIQLPTAESVLQEQCEGLLEEEEEEEEQEEEAEAEPREAPRAQKGKKTEQQRRREKEARALAQRQRREAAARSARQELFRLRALRRQVARWEAELRRRRALRAAARAAGKARPRRVGRLRYQEPALDVQLSHELPESLRVLKPEGSILRDRFKSFQKRNMIEPRERAKFKRKYRLKYVEKRAFRAVT